MFSRGVRIYGRISGRPSCTFFVTSPQISSSTSAHKLSKPPSTALLSQSRATLYRTYSMASPENTAAYLMSEKAHPLTVKPAPLVQPGENQILVKNKAIGINPIDVKLQKLAIYPLKYPAILGEDVAGEIVSVGPGVTAFQPGDRVLGTANGFDSKQDSEQGYQAYTVLETGLSCRIPDTVSFEEAVVLPLALITAAAGLFNPGFLNLQLPECPQAPSTGQTLLIWGGASSVGSSAIQLAVAAGYEVVTTASPKNFEYVKKLGASRVFDYSSATIIADLLAALKDKTVPGAFDAVGGPAWVPTAEVIAKCDGAHNKFVATVTRGFPEPPAGLEMKQVYAPSVRKTHVGKAIWADFLPRALEEKSFVPAPEPLVAGHGLEHLQTGLDLLEKGVSAKRVVVTL
jgi:NADPH:quinone reductase-like Zn-dependent oxidoreductase